MLGTKVFKDGWQLKAPKNVYAPMLVLMVFHVNTG